MGLVFRHVGGIDGTREEKHLYLGVWIGKEKHDTHGHF